MSAGARTPPAPLLERERELARLEEHFEASRRGGARLVVLSAEAGAGKTRLIEAFRHRQDGRVRFLRGRACPAGAVPYGIWSDAIEPHLSSLSRREALEAMGSAPDLRQLFAAVGEHFALPMDGMTSDIGFDHGRLFGQVGALLARLAARLPLVLVLDDLQWADASSLELLHSVVRALEDKRVLILGACRPEDVPPGAALRRTMLSLQRLGLADVMDLPPLGVGAAAAIAALASGKPWPDEAVRALHERTRGNALFIWECAEAGWERGATVLPATISGLIVERLRALNDDARRVLTLAAVIRARAPYGLLHAVTGLPEERLLAALDQLTERHLLQEGQAGAEACYEFRRSLDQESVYRALGGARRQYLHRLIASALMRGAAHASTAAQIAHHLLAGGPGDDRPDALPFLMEAARRAIAVFGNHEAVSLLRHAMRIAEKVPTDAPTRFSLHRNLGESLKRLGRFEEAVEVWETALPHCDSRERATLRRCIGRALWQAGKEGLACHHLEQGIRAAAGAEGSVELAFLHQEYALSLVRQGDTEGALAEAARALLMIDQEAEPELAARVEIVRCMAHGYRGDMRAAAEAGSRAIALSDTLAYPGAAFLACYTMAALLRCDGEARRFEALCGECDRIAEKMQAASLRSWPLSLRIERYCLTGRLREAIAMGETAVAIDHAIGQGTILPRSHAFLAVAYAWAGQGDAAARHLALAEGLADRHHKTELRCAVVVKASRACVDFLDGRLEEALAGVEALLPSLARFGRLPFYALHPHVLPLAAEAAARLGLTAKAEALSAAIGELRQRGSRGPLDGAIALIGGLMQGRAGDAQSARASFQHAASLLAHFGWPLHAARARLELAKAWEEAGDRERASRELAMAAEGLAAAGAMGELSKLRRRLARFGLQQPIGLPPRDADQPISQREMEVAKLIASGSTNRAIAATLRVSELTVETHVRNMLRKLGMRSRAQIASFVTRLNGQAPGQEALLRSTAPKRGSASSGGTAR